MELGRAISFQTLVRGACFTIFLFWPQDYWFGCCILVFPLGQHGISGATVVTFIHNIVLHLKKIQHFMQPNNMPITLPKKKNALWQQLPLPYSLQEFVMHAYILLKGKGQILKKEISLIYNIFSAFNVHRKCRSNINLFREEAFHQKWVVRLLPRYACTS